MRLDDNERVSRSRFVPGGVSLWDGGRERAHIEIDRLVCQQTERQPIRREDLTCNRPNRRRLFGRNSAARWLTLPLSVFYFSRCPIAAMTIAGRMRTCARQPAGWQLTVSDGNIFWCDTMIHRAVHFRKFLSAKEEFLMLPGQIFKWASKHFNVLLFWELL